MTINIDFEQANKMNNTTHLYERAYNQHVKASCDFHLYTLTEQLPTYDSHHVSRHYTDFNCHQVILIYQTVHHPSEVEWLNVSSTPVSNSTISVPKYYKEVHFIRIA